MGLDPDPEFGSWIFCISTSSRSRRSLVFSSDLHVRSRAGVRARAASSARATPTRRSRDDGLGVESVQRAWRRILFAWCLTRRRGDHGSTSCRFSQMQARRDRNLRSAIAHFIEAAFHRLAQHPRRRGARGGARRCVMECLAHVLERADATVVRNVVPLVVLASMTDSTLSCIQHSLSAFERRLIHLLSSRADVRREGFQGARCRDDRVLRARALVCRRDGCAECRAAHLARSAGVSFSCSRRSVRVERRLVIAVVGSRSRAGARTRCAMMKCLAHLDTRAWWPCRSRAVPCVHVVVLDRDFVTFFAISRFVFVSRRILRVFSRFCSSFFFISCFLPFSAAGVAARVHVTFPRRLATSAAWPRGLPSSKKCWCPSGIASSTAQHSAGAPPPAPRPSSWRDGQTVG